MHVPDKLKVNISELKILTVFIFILVMSLAPISVEVHAQNTTSLGLSVSPQIFELDVFPGETINKTIRLENISNAPIPILIEMSGFTAANYSGEMEFDDSLQDPSIASRKWFNIQSPNLILNTGEERDINFSIQVPQDAEPGGHYSAMLFEPQLPDFYFAPGQPKSIPVIGVLFMLSVKNLSLESSSNATNTIAISEFGVQKNSPSGISTLLADIFSFIPKNNVSFTGSLPRKFQISVKNNDIYHHEISGKISIYNSFGKIVGDSKIPDITILPGKIRDFTVDTSSTVPGFLKFLPASISGFIVNNTSLGRYRAVLQLDVGQSSLNLNQSLNVWSLPWKTILILLILFAAIILLRKRIIAATKILFKINFQRKI